MQDLYANQKIRLLKQVNLRRGTRCVRGTNRLTKTSIERNETIHEATLLHDQASNTAGGWNILRDEIASFLYRVGG